MLIPGEKIGESFENYSCNRGDRRIFSKKKKTLLMGLQPVSNINLHRCSISEYLNAFLGEIWALGVEN